MKEATNNQDFVIILFYKFVDMADPKAFVLEHKQKCVELGILGRMLVAEEGINGTLEGTRDKIEEYVKFLKGDERFADIVIKESKGNGIAFPKLKIKVRPEVVTLGAGRFNVKGETAPEISVSELKKLYENNEDFVVLDLRNDYEIASGKFDKTLDPGLANFRDLPTKLAELKKIKELKNKKIVTVCTGGIRCEKATCLMKREGFENIYQLKDGIHTYMKDYPGQDFKGSLFVFDNRLITDVVPTEDREIIGKCKFCESLTETYYSDDRTRPSRKVLCCENCFEINKQFLREGVSKEIKKVEAFKSIKTGEKVDNVALIK